MCICLNLQPKQTLLTALLDLSLPLGKCSPFFEHRPLNARNLSHVGNHVHSTTSTRLCGRSALGRSRRPYGKDVRSDFVLPIPERCSSPLRECLKTSYECLSLLARSGLWNSTLMAYSATVAQHIKRLAVVPLILSDVSRGATSFANMARIDVGRCGSMWAASKPCRSVQTTLDLGKSKIRQPLFSSPKSWNWGSRIPQVEIDLRLNFPTPLGRCGGWYRLFAHETAHEKLMDDMRAEIDCINVIICGPAVVW